MKKTLILIAISVIFMSYLQAQDNCVVTAIGLSYLIPKGASIEVIKSGKFQGGLGIMYNSLTSSEKGKTGKENSIDILAYGGVRVYHKIYRTAVYTNIGYAMGEIFGPRLYVSSKLMLLRDQKAYSVEPYYCNRLGLRISIYKII